MTQTIRENDFGTLLRHWRGQRRMSQLDLGLEANVSSRHISFIETGRARPSREMVLGLAQALDVPLRDRNVLLTAAGFAPVFRARGFDDDEMAMVRQAVQFIFDKQEPYPAILTNSSWNVLMANNGAMRVFGAFLPPEAFAEQPLNMMTMLLSPTGIRPYVVNWEDVAAYMLHRLLQEIAHEPTNEAADLLARVRAFPETEALTGRAGITSSGGPTVNLELKKDDLHLKLFSTIATFGTPQDITLAELRIETAFPADPATRDVLEEWGRGSSQASA